MVHGYHLILPHYGFWLPNDPRGSWSEFVASWEIARFGETTRHLEQRTLAMLSADELALREAARQALHYPPVTLTGSQALSIANGFKDQAIKSDYAIWACSILPEHTHLVVAGIVRSSPVILSAVCSMMSWPSPLKILKEPGPIQDKTTR